MIGFDAGWLIAQADADAELESGRRVRGGAQESHCESVDAACHAAGELAQNSSSSSLPG